jgi:GDP-L-fucose synthase
LFAERADCDLTDRDQTVKFFGRSGADYVVHLASYVPGFYNVNKVDAVATNVRINENVLEASHKAGIVKGMFCLSVTMFTDTPSKFPMDESMLLEGGLSGALAGYSYAKRILALQCQNYNEQYGTKYFGIVPSNIYGPNDNFGAGRLVPNLILKFRDAMERDSDVTLNGSGKPLRQFIYSLDLAKIITGLAMNYSDTKPVICCGDEEVSIVDLAIQIGRILDFKKKIVFDQGRDGALCRTVSNAYLKSVMPEVRFTPLREGLEATIRHMGIVK